MGKITRTRNNSGTNKTQKYLLVLTVLQVISVVSSSESTLPFESQGFVEMTNINMDPLFSKNEYMIAYFANDYQCDEECMNTLILMDEAASSIKERVTFLKVFITAEESRRVIRQLRVVDFPSIGYLANGKAVIY